MLPSLPTRPPPAPRTRSKVWQELVTSSPWLREQRRQATDSSAHAAPVINDGKELKRRRKKKKSEGEGRGAGQQLSARQVARQGVIKILG